MKLLATLLLATPFSAEANAGSAADASAVLRAVLAFETRVHQDATVGPPPCLRRRVGGDSLGGSRRAVEEYERPFPPVAPASTPPSVEVVTVVNPTEVRFSPFSHWEHPSPINRGYVDRGEELSPAEQARLRRAERAALAGPEQPRRVREIDPTWFGSPLQFCRRGDELPRLEIDSPTFADGYAFVRLDFDCVLCGQGVILALRRGSRGWEIVATALKWAS